MFHSYWTVGCCYYLINVKLSWQINYSDKMFNFLLFCVTIVVLSNLKLWIPIYIIIIIMGIILIQVQEKLHVIFKWVLPQFGKFLKMSYYIITYIMYKYLSRFFPQNWIILINAIKFLLFKPYYCLQINATFREMLFKFFYKSYFYTHKNPYMIFKSSNQ